MTTQTRPESPADAGARMVRLVEERGYLSEILGSDPATINRFKTLLLSALTGSPKLLQADTASLVQAMREAAMWDLEPDGIDAVIVPYWSSKRSCYEADFQVTARGYVRVLYRTPQVRFVDADVVYEHDHFEYEKGGTPRLVHRPMINGDRGERIGAYAFVQLDSGFMRPMFLDEKQIASRRARARDAEGGTWAEWPDEMARKTALRALMSLVPIARGVKAALAAEDAKYPVIEGRAEPVALLAAPPAVPAIEAARAAFVGPPPEPEPEAAATVTVLTEPMTPEASAQFVNAEEIAEGAPAILRPRDGLSAHELVERAKKAGKFKANIAAAIGCELADLTERIAAMTDTERGVLADELNLDWRT